MRSHVQQPSSYRDRASLPGQLASLLVALAISGLIVFMLLRLGALASGPSGTESRPIVVELLREAGKKASAKPRAERADRVRHQNPPPVKLPPPPPAVLKMLRLSHEEFAASDISRFSSPPDQAVADEGAGASDSAENVVGQAPNGERLYNAEWYREPSRAEMATYLPHDMSQGWAMIACRTIDRFHVDDCQELAESPPGSGLARALRLAAWQFLVRPPRVGGKTMVGEWVRIRFDFTQEKHADRN